MYNSISKTLNAIANNTALAEKIDVIPNAIIFRPERAPRSWAGTGLIENSEGKTELYCTKRWDVGIYNELNSHRNSDFEKKNYGNSILHYDHNPSSSSLKNTATPIKEAYENELRVIKNELDGYAIRGYPKNPHGLRDLENQLTEEERENNKKFAELTARSIYLNECLANETKELAYCIAIPKVLHKQSDTTMESKSAQAKREGNPFVEDVTAI